MRSLAAYGGKPPSSQQQQQQQRSSSQQPPTQPSQPTHPPRVATPPSGEPEARNANGGSTAAAAVPVRAIVAPPRQLSAQETHDELERRLPPAPPQTACDPELLSKIAAAVEKGQSIVARLKGNTAFKNPETIGQLVKFVDLNERGSNFPLDLYDPREAARMPSHEKLAEAQSVYLQALSRQDNPVTGQSEVQFTASTTSATSASTAKGGVAGSKRGATGPLEDSRPQQKRSGKE